MTTIARPYAIVFVLVTIFIDSIGFGPVLSEAPVRLPGAAFALVCVALVRRLPAPTDHSRAATACATASS